MSSIFQLLFKACGSFVASEHEPDVPLFFLSKLGLQSLGIWQLWEDRFLIMLLKDLFCFLKEQFCVFLCFLYFHIDLMYALLFCLTSFLCAKRNLFSSVCFIELLSCPDSHQFLLIYFWTGQALRNFSRLESFCLGNNFFTIKVEPFWRLPNWSYFSHSSWMNNSKWRVRVSWNLLKSFKILCSRYLKLKFFCNHSEVRSCICIFWGINSLVMRRKAN